MTEQWKDIPAYEGLYQVSDHGRVLGQKGHALRPGRDRLGYRTVVLSRQSHKKTFRVHRLVTAAFIGLDAREVNHKDGDRGNNRLDNLEYVSHSDNCIHSYDVLKRRPSGRKTAHTLAAADFADILTTTLALAAEAGLSVGVQNRPATDVRPGGLLLFVSGLCVDAQGCIAPPVAPTVAPPQEQQP